MIVARSKLLKKSTQKSFATPAEQQLFPQIIFTLPFSNFFTFLSIPTINLAPAILAPIMTANPTVPSPQTATVEPDSTLQLFTTAP